MQNTPPLFIFTVRQMCCNGLPLAADADEKVFKLLFLDVGLLNAMLGLDWLSLSTINDVNLVNEGTIAEQFVGQHLVELSHLHSSDGLHYWLREGKGTNAEVDFVASFHGKIVAIEVKAGASGSLKSLHQFMGEKRLPLAFRVDANPPSVQIIETMINVGGNSQKIKYTLVSIPLYLVEKIPSLVEEFYARATKTEG